MCRNLPYVLGLPQKPPKEVFYVRLALGDQGADFRIVRRQLKRRVGQEASSMRRVVHHRLNPAVEQSANTRLARIFQLYLEQLGAAKFTVIHAQRSNEQASLVTKRAVHAAPIDSHLVNQVLD